MPILLGIWILWNLVTFFLYAADKARARKKMRRIPERTLVLTAMLGGSVGALVGMYALRHKTRHWKFRILIPLFFVLHLAGIAAYAVIL